jgi:hypothetical protein
MTYLVEGMEVVCTALLEWGGSQARVGGVYTIKKVVMKPYWATPGLLFAEIEPCPPHAAFESLYFKPVSKTKSEISFTHGADPSSDQYDNRRVRVGAPA